MSNRLSNVCGVAAILLAYAASSIAAPNVGERHFSHHNVLGTSLDLKISAPKAQANQAHQAVLSEVARLEKIFSSYDTESELSRFNSGSLVQQPSPELRQMIALCEQWRQRLPSAFSCRMGSVINAWQEAEQKQLRPQRKQIRAIARRATESQFSLSDLDRPDGNNAFRWNFGAIAKGYILDKALAVARQSAADAEAISVDIGGDGVYWLAPAAARPWQVAIANPQAIDDGQRQTMGSLKISHGAVAYSGHSSRTRIIGRRSYSHILAPRDGWPVAFAATAVVHAENAVEADALATALATMEVPAALNWLDRQVDKPVAALLIGADGRQHSTDTWRQLYRSNDSGTEISAPLTATIEFTLPRPRGGEYRRPYVAVWLEDSERKIVKNLLLLGESERWMSENSYWWRKQGRVEKDLLNNLARPTRRPGEYQLLWYGDNDFGQLLPVGKYTLNIEVAREHGDHERLTIPFQLDQKLEAIAVSKQGQKEVVCLACILIQKSRCPNGRVLT